jgi:hypothetical protein
MFDSGLFGSTASTPAITKWNHPIAYFLGGTGDIAYQNVSVHYIRYNLF